MFPHQNPVLMVLGLSEDGFQILDSRHHADAHFSSLLGCVGTGVQGRSEAKDCELKIYKVHPLKIFEFVHFTRAAR